MRRAADRSDASRSGVHVTDEQRGGVHATDGQPPTAAAPARRGSGQPVEHFATTHLQSDLRGRSVRGGAATLLGQGGRFALQLGSTAVLARLLTPADFGLVAMVTAVTGLITLFKDLGLSMATIQRPRITHGQVSSLFWVNVGFSAVLMLLFVAAAPAVARFYDEPRLTALTAVIAAGFAAGGLATQHGALLRRQMRFAAMAAADLGSMLAGVLVAVGLAWWGAGYWALAAMHVTTPIVLVVAYWSLCGWRPGRPRLDPEVRSMLAFGGNLTGANILRYAVRNVDTILIGWWWGASPLGLYQRAYSLLLLPVTQLNTPITNVAVPTLSRLQHDLSRFRRYYFGAIRTTVFFGMPLVAFAFVAAPEIVLLVLGPQWEQASSIFRLLAPAGFVSTFYVATTWVYLSLGYPDRQLRWTVVNSLVTIAALVAGLPFGPEGVALAFSLAVVALRPIGVWYCYLPTDLRPVELVRALVTPTVTSLGAAAAVWWLGTLLPDDLALIPRLGTLTVLYGACYLAFTAATGDGRRLLTGVAGLTRDLRARSGEPLPEGKGKE